MVAGHAERDAQKSPRQDNMGKSERQEVGCNKPRVQGVIVEEVDAHKRTRLDSMGNKMTASARASAHKKAQTRQPVF